MGKTKTLTIRLSPEDMALLKSYTAKTRISQSAYLRTLIRGYVPKAYPPEVFFELMGKLENGGRLDGEMIEGILTLRRAVTAPEKIN